MWRGRRRRQSDTGTDTNTAGTDTDVARTDTDAVHVPAISSTGTVTSLRTCPRSFSDVAGCLAMLYMCRCRSIRRSNIALCL
jgi:hypothetical protein